MQVFDEKDLASYVLPLYRKVIGLPNGKSALKRLCIFCGICKSKKFYSLTRKAIKIGETLSCDSCFNLFSNIDDSSKDSIKCTGHNPGSTFISGNFASSKCKACRLLQILTKCETTAEKYTLVYESLGSDCQNLVDSTPPTKPLASVSNGFVMLQYYVSDKWLDVNLQEQADDVLSMDVDSDQCSDVREESENSNSGTTPPSPEEENDDSNSGCNYEENLASMDIYEEEAMIDDPEPMEEDSSVAKEKSLKQQKIKENLAYSVKSSERIRKKKKVDYIDGRKHKKCIHGPDGRILKNGRDLCDCLQDNCPGCHFPCAKCRSAKCGNECRMNRRWYYDKLEIEGTNISWTNKWAQKFN